jgi:hypothetical protein
MPRLLSGTLLCSVGAVCSLAQAAPPHGTWKFDRAADFEGRVPLGQVSRFDTIVVADNEVRFSSDCVVRFQAEEYFFSDVFQPLSKSDVTEKQVNVFLYKKLGVTLVGVKEIYSLSNAPTTCAHPITEFFVIGDRILIPSGATFYSYTKESAPGVKP